LLNFYEAQINYVPPEPKSRGQLPLIHAACKNLEEAEEQFQSLDLAPYPPFHFLAVEPSGSAILITWDGSQTMVSHPDWDNLPITTSSFETEKVVAARKALFKARVVDTGNPLTAMESFHKSPDRLPDTYAVLMTRESAKTVSVSRIDVSGSTVQMTYQARPGASSQLDSPESKSIPRNPQGL
jgi:hypothetical protein